MDPIRPEFELLDSAGLEYHHWVADVETTFVAEDFTSTINPSADAAPVTEKDKDNALMFLKRWGYHHLKTPKELWDALDSRFGNIHDSLIPQLNVLWNEIRFLDYVKVNDFQKDMLQIQAHMDFCGKKLTDEEMIQKTLSTFPTSSMILANQYRLAVGKKKVPEANHGKVNKGKGPKGKRDRHLDSHPHDPYPRGSNTSHGRGRKGHNRGRWRNGHSHVWHREGTSGHSGSDPKFDKTPTNPATKKVVDGSAPCFKCGFSGH
ncbi:uncharacterized protein LOC113272091 [Papaver somniferum]|uniref:uncharacterized protein LOC113272091 n=1 Tax=Papaver somniferum TaxID=3469 RepID=UPI000E700506|nr:uncharacterized protein LOC113272091 [Papaver somniferum]